MKSSYVPQTYRATFAKGRPHHDIVASIYESEEHEQEEPSALADFAFASYIESCVEERLVDLLFTSY